MKRLALLLLTPAAVASLAQEAPIVRVDVEPDSVAVGEAVRLRVTVLVPTFFPRPPTYPDFELANAITRLPPDSTFPTSERIGGTSWAGITRDYRLYPLTGARYRINKETIRVTYANPGSDPVVAEVPVPEVTFAGIVPAGAEDLDPYIAGEQLSLELDVSGDDRELEAGDAVVLEYTATLDGLPAIFLPRLAPLLDYDGASVYADEPVIDDGPPATRSEKLTIVFDAGGSFDVPPVALKYWNTSTGSLETAAAGAVSFVVTGSPAAEIQPPGAPARTIDWRRVLLMLALLALLLVAARALLPPILARLKARAVQRRESERYAFTQLMTALSRGHAGESYAALLEWTSRLEPAMDSRDFAATYGDAELASSLETFIGARYNDGPGADLHALRSQLAQARRHCESSRKAAINRQLPPLNPISPG